MHPQAFSLLHIAAQLASWSLVACFLFLFVGFFFFSSCYILTSYSAIILNPAEDTFPRSLCIFTCECKHISKYHLPMLLDPGLDDAYWA